ncbi:MAG TPA: glutamate--tRNA ligase [Candidatus Dojkabacteria bacterium]|nr:glutamate--tRNA ligase [Candidatus Dojkabacteria bacterium]HQI92708.1 glutamate--tRNA ligase [Candidatus Dojkabacteria bacterium]
MRTTEDNVILSQLLFPDVVETPQSMFGKYPKRELPDGAMVLRFAPSPTGFLHIGTVYMGMINTIIAKQTKGVSILRIEDTDKNREVENGVMTIVEGLRNFGIDFDEGMIGDNQSKGKYGPYIQSKRLDIYKVFAKDLVSKGYAYPCFMTERELENIRKEQEEKKLRTGCYGKWAIWRDRSLEDVKAMLEKDEKFVIRLYSTGDIEKSFNMMDLIKGYVTLRENDMDAVLLKSDGFPTYHFAHPIDDILMGITLVTRGDEWFSSVPLHVELFQKLGFKQIPYAHFSPLMKTENGSKRKLSKRKDPEADVQYYISKGYPKEGVKEYLLNIANSNFYDWKIQHPGKSPEEFALRLDKFNKAGSLFDIVKLDDMCKNYIASLSAEQVYDQALTWVEEYDKEVADILKENKDYCIKIFGIEREGPKVRKDIVKYSDIKEQLTIFFDTMFENIEYEDISGIIESTKQKEILEKYLKVFEIPNSVETWFEGVKKLAEEMGVKTGEIAMVLRVAITKKTKSPDLYQVISILGEDKVRERLEKYLGKVI